jgi:hypothetical protein
VALLLHRSDRVRVKPPVERRDPGQRDRRRNSRGGRRDNDPHFNWRRLAWLFAAYAMYLSIRALPGTIRRAWQRKRAA